jgi:hypothetical protein
MTAPAPLDYPAALNPHVGYAFAPLAQAVLAANRGLDGPHSEDAAEAYARASEAFDALARVFLPNLGPAALGAFREAIVDREADVQGAWTAAMRVEWPR